MSEEWIGLYKLGRLALLAIVLVGVTVWAFGRKRRERLEEPARRMLREDDE
jgi:cbb3-type cytochrome oxidase subunit 3